MKVITSSLVTVLLSVAPAISGTPVQSRYVYSVKDSHNVPARWARVGPAPADHSINLSIGLKQARFNELEKQLYEVSDPAHPRYGKHLTAAEVNELVKPCDDALDQVHEWLKDHDIETSKLEYTPAKDWITLQLPVTAIERLLATNYSVYKHQDGDVLIRAPSWSLPTHLHQHIDTIQPTNSFFRPNALRRTFKSLPKAEYGEHAMKSIKEVTPHTNMTVREACKGEYVTPICLRTLYGTINYTPQVPGKNRIALNNYLSEISNRSDVAIFLQRYRPDAVAGAQTFSVEIVSSKNNKTITFPNANQEGDLDAETIIAIGYPTPLVTYNTGGEPPFKADQALPDNENEPYLTWLHYILAQENIPQVISSSYGDDEQTVPEPYARSVCNQFAQLGARGVTMLCAAGDSGVGNNFECFSNDGKNTSTFLPAFPASCPYVTAVGATKGIDPEVAAYDPYNGFSGGGGFSNYFKRPAYQDSVVPPYVSSLGSKYRGLYNPAGRGYPDISALSQAFETIWNGTDNQLDGTSASTPTAAAILSLVNDALIAAGKPVLGFLNPCLYSRLHTAFTDITSGSNRGCRTLGFPSQKGWDAATGFGTPHFPNIRAAV